MRWVAAASQLIAMGQQQQGPATESDPSPGSRQPLPQLLLQDGSRTGPSTAAATSQQQPIGTALLQVRFQWHSPATGEQVGLQGAAANALDNPVPQALREERQARFMAVAEAVSTERLKRRIGATMQVLVDHAPGLGKKGGVGRSYADAPEIDGVVRLLPPEKISKTLKVGEFTRARIVSVEGHDLVGVPI
jgi:hypothetical protein